MKNKEKFAKEIFDIACRGDSIAITIANNEIVPCESIECEKCIFKVREYEECSDKIKKWCESEYVERSTLTKNEKLYLDMIKPDYMYIARDKNGLIFIYSEMPYINNSFTEWEVENSNNIRKVPDSLKDINFDFIKWEDKKPWSIEDLKKLEVKE